MSGTRYIEVSVSYKGSGPASASLVANQDFLGRCRLPCLLPFVIVPVGAITIDIVIKTHHDTRCLVPYGRYQTYGTPRTGGTGGTGRTTRTGGTRGTGRTRGA